MYSHSAYTATLLSRIRDANLAVLDGLKVSQSYPGLRGRVTDGIALSELCEIGAIDPSAASAVFTILMEELTKPSSEQYPRPQLMFTMDGLPFTMQDTKYRSPSYEHIPAHHFQLVRFFHDVLSGKRALPNGGAVLAATSATNSPKTHDVEYAISTLEYSQQWESLLPTKFESRAHDPELNQELLRLSMSAQNETKGVPTPDLYSEAEDIAHEQFVRHIPPPSMSKYLHTARVLFDPFYKYNTHVLDVFGVPKNGDPPDRRQQHIHIQRLAGLSKAESKGILEYWTSSGMAGRAVVNEATVSAAWTMAGSGMIGLMEKGVLGRPRALHS